LTKYLVEVFPVQFESSSFSQIESSLSCFDKAWQLPEIDAFLKNPSKQAERLAHLDPLFSLDEDVQSALLRSPVHRTFFDRYLQDGKCLTLEKFTSEDPSPLFFSQ
jgi:hypothetical protein